MPMNLGDMPLNNIDQLCQWLDHLRKQAPDKYAFLRRFMTALERDGYLRQQIEADAATIRRLLDAGDIDAADRWLRRKLIRCV